MSKGKRYIDEGELNYKKVVAVIIAFIVIVMFIIMMKNVINKNNNKANGSNISDYYALYTNNAWGVIDSNGNEIIEPMYQEMVVVVNNSKDVFLCTYDVNEETGEYKTKVVNKNNKEIFTGYDKVEALENYDTDGNVWYEKNILRVEKDGKYGIIDLDGKEIINPQYDNIETLKGMENSIIVEKDELKGLINSSGVNIIDTNYKKITNYGEDYKKGYITVDTDKKYGLVSYSGTEILDNNYEKIEKIYGEDYFVITEKGKQKLIDSNEKVVLSKGYDSIKQICSSGIIFVKNNKYGLMDFKGKIKIKAKYDDLKEINTDIFSAKQNKKYGVIDLKGKTKVKFKFEDVYYNSNAEIYVAEDKNYKATIMNSEFNTKLIGILSELNTDKGYIKLKTDDGYKYYNLKFEEKDTVDFYSSNTMFLSKKDGKYGFVNKEGNVIVDYEYDDATEQNKYGYAAVKKDGKWGALNQEGKVIIEPKYNLDSNLLIDFIGKWHLGQDINMNYYCDK